MAITLKFGDITTFEGDALVNTTNPQMFGGDGVDDAIHKAAGQLLGQRCFFVPATGTHLSQPVRCPQGEVRPVPATGTHLSVGWVINTVGPILNPERADHLRVGEQMAADEVEARLTLADCYRKALDLCTILGVKSVALPAISTGLFGVSHEMCAEVLYEVLLEGGFDEFLDITIFLGDEDVIMTWLEVNERLRCGNFDIDVEGC